MRFTLSKWFEWFVFIFSFFRYLSSCFQIVRTIFSWNNAIFRWTELCCHSRRKQKRETCHCNENNDKTGNQHILHFFVVLVFVFVKNLVHHHQLKSEKNDGWRSTIDYCIRMGWAVMWIRKKQKKKEIILVKNDHTVSGVPSMRTKPLFEKKREKEWRKGAKQRKRIIRYFLLLLLPTFLKEFISQFRFFASLSLSFLVMIFI